MSKRRNISEKVKNIIIVMLLVSAVFLGWESRLFGNSSVKLSVFSELLSDKTMGSDNGGEKETEKRTIGETKPLSIAVTDSNGAHFGVRYALNELDALYNNTVTLFREALGSAQSPQPTAEQNWRLALTSPNVYFEYMTPVPLSVLDVWYGNDASGEWGDVATRRLCVAVIGGASRLFFQDDSTGLFYSADTATKLESITDLVDTYDANKASFAFESISASSLKAPYTLLIPDVTEHPLLEARNPLTEIEVLQEFGVSEHVKPISGTDGASSYNEYVLDFTLRVWSDGRVRYSSQNASTAQVDESSAVTLAVQAVSESIGNYCGDARVYFDAIIPGDDNAFTIMFKYVIVGAQVYLNPDGYAAIVTIEDGIVREMELYFRKYTITEEPIKLLPELQAAAAAGGAFMLCYIDNGSDIVEPSWVVAPAYPGGEEKK